MFLKRKIRNGNSVNSRGDKKDQDSSHTGQCHFQKVKLVVGASLACPRSLMLFIRVQLPLRILAR